MPGGNGLDTTPPLSCIGSRNSVRRTIRGNEHDGSTMSDIGKLGRPLAGGGSMRMNLRHTAWAFALAITLAFFGASRFAGAAQSERGMERGRGHQGENRADDYSRNRNFQRGFEDGREDARSNRRSSYRLR